MSGHATIIAGFGGQGLLFAGKVLAQAAMTEGKMVSWMPSYGPEMRGGTASCTVIVAEGVIGSPVVDIADSVIALNPPSLAKFEPALAPGGLLVMNTSLIEALPSRVDLEVLAIPCTALARDSGHPRLASVVALGGLIARRPLVAPDSIRAALAEMTGPQHLDLLTADLAAFDAGLAAAAGTVVGATSSSADRR
ncbi:MAG: 2-oxoacid:acceptor oxidoreductase family protein [Chloroflexota bacterium]|nr:2-oxoacid:acceptor oxidoreductase family protein [Chloroflexota bacterium]MDH5244030.1 2-oxoacid:acceptor oxidoreductase family protein [Chloroflexota bacterium]